MRRLQIFMSLGVLTAVASSCSTAPVAEDTSSKSHSESGLSNAVSRTLPENGAWMRYHVVKTVTTEKVSGKIKVVVAGETVDREKTETTHEDVTLKFLASTVEEGKPCRWVEVKTVVQGEDGDKTSIQKLGNNILDSPRSGW